MSEFDTLNYDRYVKLYEASPEFIEDAQDWSRDTYGDPVDYSGSDQFYKVIQSMLDERYYETD